ncbi:MAG: dienelactone hydrolase family protein [Candidatus Eisenbacteria bacterium]
MTESRVIEQEVEIPAPDGRIDAYFLRVADDQPRPGVLHLPDIRGVRPAHIEKARRLARGGFAVLLVNVFYRTGRFPLFESPFDFAEERTKLRFQELTSPLTQDAVERDARTLIDWMLAEPGVRGSRLGVVGHCFTGGMALRYAAAVPDRVAAAASFHGGGLYNDTPTSPHLLLPRVTARLYFGHADQDRSMPAEAIAKLDEALAAWGGRHESETYAGSLHGWTVPDNKVFDPPAADRAFEKLAALMRDELRSE